MSGIRPSSYLLLSIIGFAAGILIFSRFLSDSVAPLINAMAMVCVLVGFSDLAGSHEALLSLVRIPGVMVGFFAVCATLAASRYVIVHHLLNARLRRSFRRQVLLIGTDQDAEFILKRIIALNAPFWIAGTVGTAKDCGISSPVSKTQLGCIRDLESVLGENFFHEAIITDETIQKPDLIQIVDVLTQKGITVWFLPKLMPIVDIKLYVDNLFGIPMIRMGSRRYQWLFRRLKYAFDAVATLFLFIALLPVFGVLALAVRLTSEGPVFYRTTAVGRGAGPFKMYKFRSMLAGCSADIHKDYVTCLIKGDIRPDGSGKALKITCDPRVTPVGHFLRKTSLDELPQLINVLKGEMSLVGPRPCLQYEYEVYKDWHRRRTAVRPGITGLWQVVGRSEVSFEDMILLDLYYIYNRSFNLDLSILFETLIVLVKRKGAH
jgi:exopolysaccharide biosynthesis polyprenyl glycosylphosphotransferase